MRAAPDPYCYPGTDILINAENIRDAAALSYFEVSMTAQRMREGVPSADISVRGYSEVHRFIFQDVYPWAGNFRSVDMSKGSAPFCRASFIAQEMDKRFSIIQSENLLKDLRPAQFSDRAAEHLSELNVIHPFREGNGRAMRSFLKSWGEQAGHKIELQRINPREWNEASRQSFHTADPRPMRQVIEAAISDRTREQDRNPPVREEHDRERER